MPRRSGVSFVRQKGRTPFYRTNIDRKRVHLGTDRREAYAMFGRLMSGRPVHGDDPATVAELIARWNLEYPAHWREPRLKPWGKASGRVLLSEIGPDHLEKLARYLVKSGYGAFCVSEGVRCAHHLLTWGVEREWIKAAPRRPRLPKAPKSPKDIPVDELKALLEALPDAESGRGRSTPLVEFILATGCRPKEARLLRWDQIDIRRKVCTLTKHKTAGVTGKSRPIYLTPWALKILKGIPRRGVIVFPSGRGSAYTASGLRSILRRRDQKSVYALRHSYAQMALEGGTPVEVVAKLLGHSDLQTVLTYVQVRDKQAMEAASKIRRIRRHK